MVTFLDALQAYLKTCCTKVGSIDGKLFLFDATLAKRKGAAWPHFKPKPRLKFLCDYNNELVLQQLSHRQLSPTLERSK